MLLGPSTLTIYQTKSEAWSWVLPLPRVRIEIAGYTMNFFVRWLTDLKASTVNLLSHLNGDLQHALLSNHGKNTNVLLSSGNSRQ